MCTVQNVHAIYTEFKKNTTNKYLQLLFIPSNGRSSHSSQAVLLQDHKNMDFTRSIICRPNFNKRLTSYEKLAQKTRQCATEGAPSDLHKKNHGEGKRVSDNLYQIWSKNSAGRIGEYNYTRKSAARFVKIAHTLAY